MKGGASLSLTTSGTKLTTQSVIGDYTGRVSMRLNQMFDMVQGRVLIPFGVLTQRGTQIRLPTENFDCKKVDMIIKGEF